MLYEKYNINFNSMLCTDQGNSLVVQWLELCAITAGDMGFIPGGGTKIPYAPWHGQKTNKQKKQKKVLCMVQM